MIPAEPVDLAVIGAGIGGLAAAWRAQQIGWNVAVLEAGRSVGGKMRSEIKDDYLVEHGTWRLRHDDNALWQLVDQCGLADQVITAPASAVRYIYRDRALRARPETLAELLAGDCISAKGKLRLLAEPAILGDARADDTVWSFAVRRLGEEAARFLLGPYIADEFAGDPRQLGARDALTRWWQWEHDAGSLTLGALFGSGDADPAQGKRRRPGIYALRDGMGALPKALAAALPEHSLMCSSPVHEIRRLANGLWQVQLSSHAAEPGAVLTSRRVLLATPPKVAADLLLGPCPAAAAELADVQCVRLAVVHVGVPMEAGHVPHGASVSFPHGGGLRTLKITLPSQCFPGRAPEGHVLFTGLLGGALDPEAADLSDDTLVSLVLRAYGMAFGHDGNRAAAPVFHSVVRWRDGLPQYRLGHLDAMQRARQALQSQCPGLVLAGNYLGAIGATAAAASGLAAVEELASGAWADAPRAAAGTATEVRSAT